MAESAAGLLANLPLLAAIGLGIGLIAGFAGVSGGYLLTPLLMVFGLPAADAVGTAVALQSGNNLLAILRHRRLGHVDLKLGLIMAAGALVGAEGGLRLRQLLGPEQAEVAVLGGMLVTLSAVAAIMLREVRRSSALLAQLGEDNSAAAEAEVHTAACEFLQNLAVFPHIRFTKSKLRISGWIVLLLGALVGLLSGFLGVGGGFMSNPALIYLIGQPSIMAVGTNLIAALAAVGFTCLRSAMANHVSLGLALVMLLGTAVGTEMGALGTAYVKGLAVRYVLAASVVAALLPPALKLAWLLTGSRVAGLDATARVVAIGQIFVPVGMIVTLLLMARRHFQGAPVPSWAARLMASRPAAHPRRRR